MANIKELRCQFKVKIHSFNMKDFRYNILFKYFFVVFLKYCCRLFDLMLTQQAYWPLIEKQQILRYIYLSPTYLSTVTCQFFSDDSCYGRLNHV